MSDSLAPFADAKYLSLETYRKTGAGVRTPVWFAQQDRTIYLYSEAHVGKVKRIRNNPQVSVAPCSVRGKLRGDWVRGRAHICDAQEAAIGQRLLRRRYFLKRIGDFFARLLRHNNVVIAITVD